MHLFLSTIICCFAPFYALFAAESIVAGAPILIGVSNAQKGPAQALGLNLSKGAEVYFNKINTAGGINGRQIKTITYDDGYEPVKTIQNTAKLIKEDDVFMLFGYVGTPTSKVAVPIATRAKIPYFAPFTGAEFLRSPVNPYVFNVRASYFDETERLVDHLVKVHKVNRIAAFIQDDGYGAAGRTGIQHALKKHGLEIAAVGKYKRNTKDITDALKTLKAANPEAIIMIGAYEPCAAFMKHARAAGMNSIFANISFVGTQALIQAAGEAGEGSYISQVVPHPKFSSLALVKQYQEDMKAAGAESFINFGSLEGYINALVLVEGLENTPEPLTRENLKNTLSELRFFDKGVAFFFAPELHQALHQVYLTKIENGEAVEYH